MRKALILSLLFVMLAVSASAQTLTDEEKTALDLLNFYTLAIQSFGWKCSQVQNINYGDIQVGTQGISGYYEIHKFTCENNLTYYMRRTGRAHANNVLLTFCHRGTCKKFK